MKNISPAPHLEEHNFPGQPPKISYYILMSVQGFLPCNIGVFSPLAFPQKKPEQNSLQTWDCYIDNLQVEFLRNDLFNSQQFVFKKAAFLVDEILPFDYEGGSERLIEEKLF